MRFPWQARSDSLPAPVVEASGGKRAVLEAVTTDSGLHLVAGTALLGMVTPGGEVLWQRPWMEVDSAVWQGPIATLTVRWVGVTRTEQWAIAGDGARFAEVVRERVTRSVLVAVDLEWDESTVGRAAIRRDLATGELVPQMIWSRGARVRKPERVAHAEQVLMNLCEQAGIDPARALGRAS